MNENEAQRFLNEQRYQAELPFPVSAVFTHYARSSSKNYALRSLQLVATAQSTIRYAAIAAACDYATNHDADESVLNWLRQEWLGGKKPSFGTWYGALMRLLAESGKSWRNPFVPEFTEIDRELLEKKIQPLIHSRNVEIGHAEYYEALALKHFVELQEENLFAVIEQFSFLSRYPLAFAEVEDDYEPPSPGTKQAINICRGASHNFARYTVAPSTPLPPGIPFIWNPEYTGILTLSPFLIYGRATTDAEQKERVKGVAHIQGLMVLNGVAKGSPVYTSVDAEAQFSLDSFEFPPKEKIQAQVENALKKGLEVPARKETKLAEEEKELFVRTSDFVAPVFEKESVSLQRKILPLKTILVSAILGVLVLITGFALYSRFMAPKQQIRSIAVLAFRNISDDPKQEYLCEGIAETIINTLTPIDGLTVTAPTSAFSFNGKKVTIAEIGKVLNVETILEGSLQKEEDNIRITARLIKVDGEHLLWSNTYNRKMESIFSIQDEISEAIVREMKGKLLKEEKTAIKKRGTENTEAYNLYLWGLHNWNKRTEEGYNSALTYYQQAIEKDPDYVLAYVGIADTYNYMGISGMVPYVETYPLSIKAVTKALELDNTLAEAHASLGWIKCFHFEWSDAEKEFKTSIKLNQNYAMTHHWYAYLLSASGRYEEAIKEAKVALELDPLSPITNRGLGTVYYLARQYDQAIQAFNKALELDTDSTTLIRYLSEVYYYKNLDNESIEALKRYLSLIGYEDLSTLVNRIYTASGYKAAIIQLAREVKNRSIQSLMPRIIFTITGEKDTLLELLEKSYKAHTISIFTLKVHPSYDILRSDPRYKDLLKKIGLPE